MLHHQEAFIAPAKASGPEQSDCERVQEAVAGNLVVVILLRRVRCHFEETGRAQRHWPVAG